MIKNVIIVLTIIVTVGYSCSNNQINELQGLYVIGGFRQQPDINPDTLYNLVISKFGETPFNFISKDSVILDEKFGETFFGASEFKYQLTNKTLTFIEGDKRIVMNYTYDGAFRLDIDNPYLVRLDLIKKTK